MARKQPPSYLFSSDDRLRRREAARARARRRRRVALAALCLFLVAGGAVAFVSLRGSDGRALSLDSAKHGTADALGPTTVRGSKANESATTASLKVAAPRASSASGLTGLHGKTVAIDPGHNGANYAHTAEINRLVDAGTLRKPCDTTGTETAGGYTEAAYNLDVALRLAVLLRRAGARVVMTRTTNTGWGPCITERAAIGNRANADAAISIHADGGPASGRGFHVIYPPSLKGLTDDIAAASLRLALDLRRSYARGTGMPYATYIGHAGLDERSDLGGLNLSDVPKVFIETGNMRNATDAARLESGAYRQRAAAAIARGLAAFLAGA